MDNLISASLTPRQWNVLEVALDRFIEDQVDDVSEEAQEYAARANIVKILMQHQLKNVESYYGN